MATKGDFVLALSDEGELFGWGNNEYGQLSMIGADETTTTTQIGVARHLNLPAHVRRPVLSVAASGTHALVVDAEHTVWTWGYGMLGCGPRVEQSAAPLRLSSALFGIYDEIANTLDKRAVRVYCGLNSSGVVLNDGSLFMWGKNRYGNLGLGEKHDAFMPLRVNIPARVCDLDCGPDQTFAICRTNL